MLFSIKVLILEIKLLLRNLLKIYAFGLDCIWIFNLLVALVHVGLTTFVATDVIAALSSVVKLVPSYNPSFIAAIN